MSGKPTMREFYEAMLAVIREHGMGKRTTFLKDGRVCSQGAAMLALGLTPSHLVTRDEMVVLNRYLGPLAEEIKAQYPRRVLRYQQPVQVVIAFNDSGSTRVPRDVEPLVEKVLAKEALP